MFTDYNSTSQLARAIYILTAAISASSNLYMHGVTVADPAQDVNLFNIIRSVTSYL